MPNQNVPTSPAALPTVGKTESVGPAENRTDTSRSDLNSSFVEKSTPVDPSMIQRGVQAAVAQRFAEAIVNQIERAAGLRTPTAPNIPGLGQPLPGTLPITGSQMAALLRGLGQDSPAGSALANQFKNPANSETITSPFRVASQEQQASSTAFSTRATSTTQPTEAPRLNQRDSTSVVQKDTAGTPQRAMTSEVKPDQSNELRRVDSRAEVIIPDVSHKNIAQALEAALDKMLKGSATSPDTKIATPTQQSASPQSDVSAAVSALQTTDKGATLSSPQQATQTNHQQQSEQVQNQLSGMHQAKPLENLTTANTPPSNTPAMQTEQQLHLHIRNAIEQGLEQIQNQRAEQLRLIQQITAAQVEVPQPQKPPTLAPDATVNAHPRHVSTNLAVEGLRESLLDKFLSIQTQIETAASERQRIKPTTSADNQLVQGRATLTKETPIHHDAKPHHELRHSDRTSDVQKLTQSIFAKGTVPLASAVYPSATNIAQTNPTTFSLHSLGNILKTLQIFARSSTNTKLITKMDSTLERTCLALATGAAVGVVGVEILVKTVGMGIREILRLVREGMEEERSPSDEALEAALVNVIDEYVVEGALEPSKRSMVADVSGVLICSHTREPLADVLVGSHELGSCMTDSAGRFLFSNVKIGTSYSMKFFKPLFELSPDNLSGTCSFDSHHQVEVARTRLR